jgi:uncharacterized protein
MRRRYWSDDSSGHGEAHHERVRRNTISIAHEFDRSVDREVLSAAALTHDVHRVIGSSVMPPECLDKAREVLEAAGFDGDIGCVLHCVEVHGEYDFQEGWVLGLDTIGAEVIQDADNLDAVGPVGVARLFYFAGDHENPMYDPEHDAVDTCDREDFTDTPVQHFHEKLRRLDSAVNTESGRRRAQKRISQMREFIGAFEQDWKAGKSF